MDDFQTRTAAKAARLDGWTPIHVAKQLRHLPGLVFFDTAGNFPSGASRPISVIAARPQRVIRGSIFCELDRAAISSALCEANDQRGDFGFPMGGLCGWVEYEGRFVFGDYREMLVHCHDDGSWWEIGDLSAALKDTTETMARIGNFDEGTTHEDFLDAVRRVKSYIAAGDVYQANLSQSFSATVSGGGLFGLYEVLRDVSPAPMASYIALEGREVLSSSPETFLKISGRGIETRPIKGTRPRFSDPDEDRRSAYELQTSAKEIAELVMITDLLRNDLGQVCEFGSVGVSEMLQLESLAQVHHLVSTVSGRMRPEIGVADALSACFPGGSITGAPKKRAMEIIQELENSKRGVYCGAVGWLGFNGESSFNIAIRTLVRQHGRVIYRVGAGIVADSDPELEYQETLYKASGIRLAIEQWNR